MQALIAQPRVNFRFRHEKKLPTFDFAMKKKLLLFSPRKQKLVEKKMKYCTPAPFWEMVHASKFVFLQRGTDPAHQTSFFSNCEPTHHAKLHFFPNTNRPTTPNFIFFQTGTDPPHQTSFFSKRGMAHHATFAIFTPKTDGATRGKACLRPGLPVSPRDPCGALWGRGGTPILI